MSSSWLADARDARSQMIHLQEQQASLSDAVKQRFPQPTVLRVFQLDADRLDTELVKLLRSQVGNVFSLSHESFAFRVQEELDLALQLILYKFSLWDSNASVGDQLQNMVYRNEAVAAKTGRTAFLRATIETAPTVTQKILRLLLTVLLPYFVNKLQRRALAEDWASEPESSWKYRAQWIVAKGQIALQALGVLNAVAFLRYGQYRSVVDRLLRMRLVYGSQRMNRVVNLSYMNQQVYWTVVFNFMNFALPLLSLGRWWRKAAGFVRGSEHSLGGDASHADRNACAICGARPVCVPYSGACGHLFCYYCIASQAPSLVRTGLDVADEVDSFNCPRCSQNLRSVAPFAAVA